mgnify:CR=1 FL=1
MNFENFSASVRHIGGANPLVLEFSFKALIIEEHIDKLLKFVPKHFQYRLFYITNLLKL